METNYGNSMEVLHTLKIRNYSVGEYIKILSMKLRSSKRQWH